MAEETKKESKKTLSSRFASLKGEYKKIIWPSKKELKVQTGTVIITCAILALIIFGLDFVLVSALDFLLGLISDF